MRTLEIIGGIVDESVARENPTDMVGATKLTRAALSLSFEYEG